MEHGARWLHDLPWVVAALAAQWDLDVGQAFPGCHVSFTAPVRRADSGAAVLKVQFPHPESEHEADALRAWNGDGAVRLLDHDPTRHALVVGAMPARRSSRRGRDRSGVGRVDRPAASFVDTCRPSRSRRWPTKQFDGVRSSRRVMSRRARRASHDCWTPPSRRSTHSVRRKPNECCCTKTCTPTTWSRPSESRGW